MEVFAARHPIFNELKEVYGYELEFRSDFDTYYDALGEDKTSADFAAFVNYAELTDGRRGFIRFSRDLLLIEFPGLFPRDSMVVEIVVDNPHDAELLAACRRMRDAGYVLALDGCRPAHLDNGLMDCVRMAKVYLAGTKPPERQSLARDLAARGVEAVAADVGSPGDFAEGLRWGYRYFQGDFFTRPEVREDRKIAPSKLAYLRVLNEVNKPGMSYDELTEAIKHDVNLTYKLLRFMNSPCFGLRYEIQSIKHALVMLGPEEIRRWFSLIVIRDSGGDKPRELLVRSLTRAKVAEQIAPAIGKSKLAPKLFLLGMFSVIDALTDSPMDVVLEELPIDKDVKAALLGKAGLPRTVFDAMLAYERGHWTPFSEHCRKIGLPEDKVPDFFRDALRWANQAIDEA